MVEKISRTTDNKDHGRIEIRRYWLLKSVEHLIDSHLWSGLKRIGLIESERRIQGQAPTFERRYYLMSLDGGVKRFAQASRSHWEIENQLQWCLDVAFKEDDSRIRLFVKKVKDKVKNQTSQLSELLCCLDSC